MGDTTLQYVFLDVGETLVQVTGPGAVYRALFARFGYEVDASEVELATRVLLRELDAVYPSPRQADHTISAALAQRRREVLVERLLAHFGVAATHVAALTEAIRASWIGGELFPLYPDVPAALAALRAAGYRLGIISNWEPRLPALCERLGIHEHFDFVVVSEREGVVKPHRRMFERALELAGVSPSAAIHVGDSYAEDIEGARAVGIAGVLIDRKRHGRVPYRPTIHSLAELPALLAAKQVAW
ncbi:MAG: HAD-IA family hydrolase [Chloroflexi bacterium]|nr:HAD-IA family hydrolase [Chloroflexota bacterium]